MSRLFGTDGVRGVANTELSPELALSIAMAAARVVGETDRDTVPTAVVGRDPRASGEMLEAAVVAGLASAGADVVRVGVLPTPAIAHLTGALGADIGVMLSASHNPMPDNGIKLFARGGHKLPDETEDMIESFVESGGCGTRPVGAGIGRVRDACDQSAVYIDHLIASLPNPVQGLRVVVDCANGAASGVAAKAYRRAGAEVVAINADPDGININDNCGSTHMDVVRQMVIDHRADLGIAHDGDADRCLAVSADGGDVDGDQIMAILACAMRERESLYKDTLVATVMSNLGLKLAMAEAGIRLIETKVGDRYVLEELRAHGYSLGGEQSGHIVLPSYATTGDGLLTALHLMSWMVKTGRSLSDLATVMHRLPQVLINVPVGDKTVGSAAPEVINAITSVEEELGKSGRVLVRPSGTEPLVRVMVEAMTQQIAHDAAERIVRSVRQASPAGV